jgi:hypothetical protein
MSDELRTVDRVALVIFWTLVLVVFMVVVVVAP